MNEDPLQVGRDILTKARELNYEIYICRECCGNWTLNPCLLVAPVIHEELSCDGLPLPVCQFDCEYPKWERLDETLVRQMIEDVKV